jgi:tetratricopeptide (TPR) repeat protein
LLGALTLLGPARATAQPSAPSPAEAAAISSTTSAKTPTADEVQQAKQDIDSALTAASRNDFDKAIVFYRRAYRVLPHPSLLFSAAQAYRLSGQPGRALALFHRYLAAAPDGPHAAFTRQIVDKLELHLVEPIEDPAWDDPNAPPAPVAPPPAHDPQREDFWKWSTIGTAGVAVLATAYYWYAKHEVDVHADRGRTATDQPFNADCPDGEARNAAFERACTYQHRGNIAFYTLIGASALSVGSLIMWVHSRGGDHVNEYNRQPDFAFAPVVTNTGGGATVSMRW